LIKKTWGLRVSAEEELAGLDRIEHGSDAYPEFLDQMPLPLRATAS
jgi:ammonia channel protein AmtB